MSAVEGRDWYGEYYQNQAGEPVPSDYQGGWDNWDKYDADGNWIGAIEKIVEKPCEWKVPFEDRVDEQS